ncbi:hypothetical protein lse_0336 [Listeria seeligeri serovar 1/2b str. SLCC3954]|nr:hypothetical protein lse_0336 [Listeria seeligeri serovar 1/2b str. SLCC3954]
MSAIQLYLFFEAAVKSPHDFYFSFAWYNFEKEN